MINLGRTRRWAGRPDAVERAAKALARRGKKTMPEPDDIECLSIEMASRIAAIDSSSSKVAKYVEGKLREVRSAALEEAAKLCETHAEWAGEPGRMPAEVRSGSVGASLGCAREIRGLALLQHGEDGKGQARE